MADTQTAVEKAKEWFGVEPYDSLSAIGHAAGILDVVKQEWGEAWTEHDQKTRAGLSVLLQAAPPVAMSTPTEPVADVPSGDTVLPECPGCRWANKSHRRNCPVSLRQHIEALAAKVLDYKAKYEAAISEVESLRSYRFNADHALNLAILDSREAPPWLPEPDAEGWWWHKLGQDVQALEVTTLLPALGDERRVLYVSALGSYANYCGGLWQKVAGPK